jgi:hypothetical protein
VNRGPLTADRTPLTADGSRSPLTADRSPLTAAARR